MHTHTCERCGGSWSCEAPPVWDDFDECVLSVCPTCASSEPCEYTDCPNPAARQSPASNDHHDGFVFICQPCAEAIDCG